MAKPSQREFQPKRTFAQVREDDFVLLCSEIVKDHEKLGFSYPKKAMTMLGLKSPLAITFVPRTSPGRIPSTSIYFDGLGVSVDLHALYDVPNIMSELYQPDVQHDTRLKGNVPRILNIIKGLAHLYVSLRVQQKKALCSEALGAYLLSILLRANPQSWLNVDTIAGAIVKGGMVKYFGHMYVPKTTGVSADVWTKYETDPALSLWSSLHQTFYDDLSHELILPIMRDFRQEGIKWLIGNPPSNESNQKIAFLPDYIAQSYESLSRLDAGN